MLPKHEELRCEPISPYAVSKLATESYALAYARSFGLSVLALRFFNVFGPFQAAGHAYAAVVPAFVDAALSGRPLPIYGDGTQSRDFTFVDSVTSVLTEAVRRRLGAPSPLNLAFGTRTTLLDVVAELEVILARSLSRDHRPPRTGDVPHSQADGRRLAELFPAVRPVPLTEGLRATASWFQAHAGLVPAEVPAPR